MLSVTLFGINTSHFTASIFLKYVLLELQIWLDVWILKFWLLYLIPVLFKLCWRFETFFDHSITLNLIQQQEKKNPGLVVKNANAFQVLVRNSQWKILLDTILKSYVLLWFKFSQRYCEPTCRFFKTLKELMVVITVLMKRLMSVSRIILVIFDVP